MRSIRLRERNLKQFQQEMTGDRAMIYQHFMNKDDNDYRTKTKERSKENTELKRTAKKLFTLNENR